MNDTISRLKISCLESTYLIDTSEISHMHASGNYSFVYYDGKYVLASKTLRHLYNQLRDDKFIKPHRSYYVNVEHIANVDYFKRELTLRSGEIIPIARSKRKVIQSILSHHHYQ